MDGYLTQDIVSYYTTLKYSLEFLYVNPNVLNKPFLFMFRNDAFWKKLQFGPYTERAGLCVYLENPQVVADCESEDFAGLELPMKREAITRRVCLPMY